MIKQKFTKKRGITRKTKITIFKTVLRSITWELTNIMKSKLQAVEMKYLKVVKGITRKDRIRNDDVRTKLETDSVLEYIKRKQME